MAKWVIRPEDLGKVIQNNLKKMPGVIRAGAYLGALEGARLLAHRTPSFTGKTAARWKGHRGVGKKELAFIENDSPIVGILDLGARPHPVNAEGIAALTVWAAGKLGLPPDEAERVARAIAWRIRKKGTKPTYFVRDSKQDLADAAARNIAFKIEEHAGRPPEA
jgi:hypothetical protein